MARGIHGSTDKKTNNINYLHNNNYGASIFKRFGLSVGNEPSLLNINSGSIRKIELVHKPAQKNNSALVQATGLNQHCKFLSLIMAGTIATSGIAGKALAKDIKFAGPDSIKPTHTEIAQAAKGGISMDENGSYVNFKGKKIYLETTADSGRIESDASQEKVISKEDIDILYKEGQLSNLSKKRFVKLGDKQNRVLYYFNIGLRKGIENKNEKPLSPDEKKLLGFNLITYYTNLKQMQELIDNPSGKNEGGIGLEQIGIKIEALIPIGNVLSSKGKIVYDNFNIILDKRIQQSEQRIQKIIQDIKNLKQMMQLL